MSDSQGTPKTLHQALEFGLCVGSLKQVKDNTENILRGFINTNCATAMLELEVFRGDPNSKDSPELIMARLYERLTKE